MLPPQVSPKMDAIVNLLLQHDARVYLVGGAVRDLIMQLPIHDIDIEVHGMAPEKLEQLLAQHGPVHYDGKSFGVFRLDHCPLMVAATT